MTARTLARTTAVLAATTLAALAGGCDRGSEQSALVGRNASVEYRTTGEKARQRSGTLRKVTADYVVIDEQGNEIWIPRDVVLEIRLEKK
ncbi:MAG TPA: hypothetical protein VF796_15980 [Humisphaera sp.]